MYTPKAHSRSPPETARPMVHCAYQRALRQSLYGFRTSRLNALPGWTTFERRGRIVASVDRTPLAASLKRLRKLLRALPGWATSEQHGRGETSADTTHLDALRKRAQTLQSRAHTRPGGWGAHNQARRVSRTARHGANVLHDEKQTTSRDRLHLGHAVTCGELQGGAVSAACMARSPHAASARRRQP